MTEISNYVTMRQSTMNVSLYHRSFPLVWLEVHLLESVLDLGLLIPDFQDCTKATLAEWYIRTELQF